MPNRDDPSYPLLPSEIEAGPSSHSLTRITSRHASRPSSSLGFRVDSPDHGDERSTRFSDDIERHGELGVGHAMSTTGTGGSGASGRRTPVPALRHSEDKTICELSTCNNGFPAALKEICKGAETASVQDAR